MAEKQPIKGVLWGVITPLTPVIAPLRTFAPKRIESSEDSRIGEDDSKFVRRKIRPRNKNLKPQTVYYTDHVDRSKTHLLVKSQSIHYPRWFVKIYNYVIVYMLESPIHGFKYMAETRSWCEKILWYTITFGSMVIGMVMMYWLYRKNSDNPIILTYAANFIDVHEVPFPAVTICPTSVVSSETFNYNEVYMKRTAGLPTTPEDLRHFQVVHMLCDRPSIEEFTNESRDFDTTMDEIEMFNILTDLSPSIDDIFFKCDYNQEQITACSTLFKPIIVDQGICYTFNTLHWQQTFQVEKGIIHMWQYFNDTTLRGMDWNINLGVYNKNTFLAYPKRARFSGTKNGLTLVLKHKKAPRDTICKLGRVGFRVMVHNPVEIPIMGDHSTRLTLGTTNSWAVQPELTKTTEAVKMIHHSKRNCYHDEDKILEYYKQYSYHTCVSECHANYYIEQCGCVSFYFPRKRGTPICGGERHACLLEAKRSIQALALKKKFSFGQSFLNKCACLPLCSELKYLLVTAETGWEWTEYNNATRREHVDISEDTSVTRLNIYFNNDKFAAYERSILYSRIDLIANSGGLLTLFTGMSLMSVIEILYYCTIRLYYNKRLFGKYDQTHH